MLLYALLILHERNFYYNIVYDSILVIIFNYFIHLKHYVWKDLGHFLLFLIQDMFLRCHVKINSSYV